jgi:hypothetical protein
MGAPEGSLAGSASVTSNTNLIAAPAAHGGLLNIGDPRTRRRAASGAATGQG